MLISIASTLVPPVPAPTASVTSAATSSGLSFGTTVVVAAIAGTLILVGLVRILAAVMPRLVQALVVVGSMVLAAGVVSTVVVLIDSLYEVVRPR
jgi:hypothetical protein